MKRKLSIILVMVVFLLPLMGFGCSSTSPGKIAFISDFEDPGHVSIAYSVDPDGSNQIRLGECGLSVLEWSLDGTRIAFFGPDGELWTADADGTNVSRVKLSTMERLNPWMGAGISWSPDGTEIAVVGGFPQSPNNYIAEVYTIDVETGEIERLTDSPDIYKVGPLWSPDGKQIAFTAFGADPSYCIYVMDADGSKQRLLVSAPKTTGEISWSPDGEKIMYVPRVGKRGYGEIYLVDVEDGTSINLTNSPDIHDCDPAWSPDGKKIAFSSGKYGSEQIHVMDADGSNLIKLTDEEFGGYDESQWSPDGKRFLFSARYGPSWSPDGKTIAFSSSTLSRPECKGERWGSIFTVDIHSRSVTDLIAAGPGDYFRPVWSPR